MLTPAKITYSLQIDFVRFEDMGRHVVLKATLLQGGVVSQTWEERKLCKGDSLTIKDFLVFHQEPHEAST
jgi:hypothetical protein